VARELNDPKKKKGRLGPLSKPAKVAPHLNLVGELPKFPGASATMRSKAMVMLFWKNEMRKHLLTEALVW
jgi:hypothetical protein